MTYDPRMYEPVRVDWYVSTNPDHTPGVEYLCFVKSGITLFTLTPIEIGFPFCKKSIKYRICSTLQGHEGRPFGGYYDSVEEAKEEAMLFTSRILRGWPEDEPDEDFSI